MMIRVRLLAGVCAAALLTHAAAAQPDSSLAAGTAHGGSANLPSASNAAVETIVVTASKRKESILKTPQSVVALSGAQLQALNAQSFRQYIDLVPSLNYESNGGGGARYNIRGVAALSQVNNDIATVGYYLDEVPISESSVGADITPYDIQRIEVLRGPQGTLYGEGSIGGTIKVVTRKPDASAYAATVESAVSGTDGGGLNHDVNAMVNIPLVRDQLALRAVATSDRESGYLNDPVNGFQNTNWDRKDEARVALRYTPDRDLTVDASTFYEYRRVGDFNFDFSLAGPTVPNAEGVGSAFGLAPASATSIIPNLASPYTSTSPFPQDFTTQRWIENVAINYDLGWAQLLSSSSYYKLSYREHLDAPDDAHNVELAAAGFGIPLTARGGSPIYYVSDAEVVSEEVRLTSPSSQSLRWLAGFFYRDRTNNFTSNEQVPVLKPLLGRSELFNANQQVSFEQYALFGEATYDILPALHLTAGARIFSEDVNGTGQTSTLNTGYIPSKPLLALVSFPTSGGQKQKDAVFKASLAYDITPDWHTYALFSEGSRPGGLNQRLITPYLPRFFQSDNTRNYEVGLKESALDHRFTSSLSLFQIDWDNTQIYINAPSGGQNIYNIPAGSRVRGLELDAAYHVTPAIELGGAYGYLQSTTQGPLNFYNSVQRPTQSTIASGFDLPDVPRHKLSGYVEVSHRFEAVTVTGRVEDAYVDSRLPYIGSPYRLGAYDKLDAQLTATWRAYTAELFGQNLLNRRIETEGAQPGFYGIAVDRPVTVGLRLAASF